MLKKTISVLLALILILGIITVLPFSSLCGYKRYYWGLCMEFGRLYTENFWQRIHE